jgi:hypothetical protein
MDILNGHIGGQDQFVPTPDCYQSRIVADTESQPSFEPCGPSLSTPVFMG